MTIGKRTPLNFGIPIDLIESRKHHDDCYFGSVIIKGTNRNNKHKQTDLDLDLTKKPALHSEEMPYPSFSGLPILPNNDTKPSTPDEFPCMNLIQSFNQHERNCLIINLSLVKNFLNYLLPN